MDDRLDALLKAAETFFHRGTEARASVRRAIGTSDWKHDPKRLAAAEAKRARKNARRAACR